MIYNSIFKLHQVSDDYENILNDLMLDALIRKLISNDSLIKNKTMIVEMKAPSVIPSPCFFLLYPACILTNKLYAKTEMR